MCEVDEPALGEYLSTKCKYERLPAERVEIGATERTQLTNWVGWRHGVLFLRTRF